MSEIEMVRDGLIGSVVLSRPERRNALNDALLDHLAQALDELARDQQVRVVVIRGAGRDFCVGADLEALAATPFASGDRDQQVTFLHRQSRASLLLREMPKITIAGIDGACAGAGMGLAMAADFRIVSRRAVFKTAFVSAAMSGDFGLGWSLSSIVGGRVARELLLTDPRVDADRAGALGLATEVVDADGWWEATMAWARRLADLPPLAVAGIKANLAEASLTFDEALRREGPRHIDCARSGDAFEAARAFIERRPGVFTGS